jgi:hypothetical protein
MHALHAVQVEAGQVSGWTLEEKDRYILLFE